MPTALPTATPRVDGALPGPPCPWWGLPLLRAMRRDYLGFALGLQRAHGDVVAMRFGRERTVDLFSPELARSVLVEHADALVRWERGREVFAQSLGQSVLVTEGELWQRQRRMLMPAFTPRRVAGYADLMVRSARRALDGAVPAQSGAAEVDMDALFTRMAMDVILGTLFGQAARARADGDFDRSSAEAAAALRVLGETAMREFFWPVTLPDWLPLPGKAAKRHALRLLDALVAGHIARRRALAPADADGDDLLGMLLALRDEASGQGLTEQELADQCMVTFQAGHETTATALLWWSRLMAEHPAVAERAHDEVAQALQGRDPGAQDAAALPWLTATLKEAMRLYPPIAALMSRRATRDIKVGGWPIARGTLIRITPWVFHHDARHFAEPESFRPERFLGDGQDKGDGAAQAARGAYMPFGAGPRVCLGQHFAMLEMTLLAAMLLQRYRLALPEDSPAATPVLNVTLRPPAGMRLVMQRRAAAPPSPRG